MQQSFFRLPLCLLLLAVGTPSAWATDFYVDASVGGGGTGSSTNPFNHIQDGINAALGGDRVLVVPGVYVETLIIANKSIAVAGLSASTLAPTIQGHVSFIGTSAAQNTSSLTSFIIAPGTSTFSLGGGVTCTDSSPTFFDCTIHHFSAYNGGGVYIYQTNNGPAVTSRFDACVFDDNLATASGGAVYVGAQTGGTGNPDVLFCNCQFTSNTANDGGGVYLDSFTGSALYCCNLQNNSATLSGGALFARNGPHADMHGCFVRNNSYGATGGGMCLIDVTSSLVVDSVFYRNRSGHLGGGIYAQKTEAAAPMRISNCLFTSNGADYGGGVYLNSESAVITFSSFSLNSASVFGGGIAIVFASLSSVTVADSILWNDTAGSVPFGSEWIHEMYPSGGSAPIVAYSDIQYQTLLTCPWLGSGPIEMNLPPVFATGLYSCLLTPSSVTKFFLTQGSSPCVDAADPFATTPTGSTEPTAGAADVGAPDMGYHYPFTSCICPCP